MTPPPRSASMRRVPAGGLAVGSFCRPRANRPSGSFLRTQWRVCGRNGDGQIVLRLGRQVRLLDPRCAVLVDAVFES